MQGSFLHVSTNWHAKFGAVLAMFDFSEKSRGRSCMWPFKYFALHVQYMYVVSPKNS